MGAVGALPVLEHNLQVYRRSWRGSAFVSFLSPVLFLAAIGVGLGSLVNRSSGGGVDGVPYVQFLAPGLLAANAVQTAAAAGTYPVMAKVVWYRTYDAMLATPVAVTDIVLGETAWFCFRLLLASSSFFLVMTAFGTVRSPWGLLAVPAAVLTGLAFAMPLVAFAVTQRTDSPFSLVFRVVVLPLFLFSGTFFPLDRLPAPLQAAAWATPLFHGVSLTRALTLGRPNLAVALLHVAALVLFLAAGLVATRIALARRLVT
jgi:lipooligosaccharide transport system permease protein